MHWWGLPEGHSRVSKQAGAYWLDSTFRTCYSGTDNTDIVQFLFSSHILSLQISFHFHRPRCHNYKLRFSTKTSWGLLSSVATGGHPRTCPPWVVTRAPAHPAPTALGHRIRADPKFFWGRGGGLVEETEDGLGNKIWKAFDSCKLFVYIWVWGLCPRPPPGLLPWTPLGDFRPPYRLCPPWFQSLVTPLGLVGAEKSLITKQQCLDAKLRPLDHCHSLEWYCIIEELQRTLQKTWNDLPQKPVANTVQNSILRAIIK